jgi:hypothetical protein
MARRRAAKGTAMSDDLTLLTARTARLNATSILVIAGLAVAWSAVDGEPGFAAFGAAVCAAALVELAGARRLASDPAGARPFLVGGELAVLALIVGYCLWRLVGFDFDAELAAMPADAREALLGVSGDDVDALRGMMTMVNRATYSVLLVVTLAYQGGMALYYRRRVAAILAGRAGA